MICLGVDHQKCTDRKEITRVRTVGKACSDFFLQLRIVSVPFYDFGKVKENSFELLLILCFIQSLYCVLGVAMYFISLPN